MRLVGDALFESGHKAGLADPRLARDQHDLAFTFPGEPLAFQKEFDFVFAADKISQTRRVDRFETAPEAETPSTAHAATGSAMPLTLCRPRSRRRKRSPSSLRVEAATTTVPGSARA